MQKPMLRFFLAGLSAYCLLGPAVTAGGSEGGTSASIGSPGLSGLPSGPNGSPADCGTSPMTVPVTIPVERGTTFDSVLARLGADRSFEADPTSPGIPPEGDNPGQAVFTADGNRVLVTNMMTNNVTVFAWPALELLANIEVGACPYGIAATNDLAVVACATSNQAYVLRLSDYSVAGVLQAGERPWVVRTSPDGRFAYIGCEVSQTCEKIDLLALTHVLTIPDFPERLASVSYNSANGRFWPAFTPFEVTPDGGHVVTGDWTDSVCSYNTATGVMDHVVSGIPNCPSVALSGDGARLIAMSLGTFQFHQIDLASFVKTATVTPAGISWGATYRMAVNQDGSKVFVSLSDNRSAIIRFGTNDYVSIPETLSPMWIGVSPDHEYAIGGQNRFSVVSFATDAMVGQWTGGTQFFGAVSPAGRRVASCDPHYSDDTAFFDYTNPAAPQFRGSLPCGAPPEGDASRRVRITPDGRKAVVLNELSANATLIDLQTHEIEAILPIGPHPQELAITSDSRYCAITSLTPGTLSVVDLSTDTVVAAVACGTGPMVVAIAPDNRTAYVGDISQDVLWVVHLEGPASHLVTQIPAGNMGRLLLAGTVCSDVAVSPDGNEVLVAASFDNKVKVVSTATNTVVADIWVNGTLPLQLAFDETGDYAMVTNWESDNVTNMRISGATSTRIDNRGWGDGPLRLAPNPVRHQIGVGIVWDRKVVHLDPASGNLVRSDDYSAWGSVLQVCFDEAGEPVALVVPSDGPGTLVRNGEGVFMPAPACTFDYSPASHTAVVVCPGPDYAVLVEWDATGSPEVTTLPLSGKAGFTGAGQNPVRHEATLAFSLPRECMVGIDLVDAAGRAVERIAERTFPSGRHELRWPADGVAAGTYFAVLRVDGMQVDRRKLTVVR